jgi:drug/metabolite transporter (DMT)-like permease
VYTKRNTIFWAVISCLLWSTAYATIKIGLKYDEPFHFAGIRFIVAGILILPFTIKPSAYIKEVAEHWKVVAWVTLLQVIVNYTFFYQGLKLVPGALGAVVFGSQPLFTALVSSYKNKNDKLTRQKIITIVFGISGVLLISAGRQAFKLGTLLELLGIGMILAGNIAIATSNVIISLRSKGLNPFVLSSSSLFLGGVFLYLVSIPIEGAPAGPLPAEYWIVLGWLCFMGAAAFSIWYKLLQRPGVKVSELNLWKFIIPVAGAILSWLLVEGEKPDWLTISGMVIITASLILFSKNLKMTGNNKT